MALTRRSLALSALFSGAAVGLASPAAAKAVVKEVPKVPAGVDKTARPAFTAADSDATTVAGIAGARFAADDAAAFLAALGNDAGIGRDPWLTLSGGGSNGAFGAGLVAGWTATGRRPIFSVVTGISTGALTAPFAFAGPQHDPALRAAYTEVDAADIFEFGATPESLLDTWPLAKLIERNITPALLADIAAGHRAGRRLFVITTNVDTGRAVGWNLGAIAVAGGPAAAKLFRDVLLASSSIPGIFPPTHIAVEANGRTFSEMHVDGGVTSAFFVAPEPMVATGSALPARQVYAVVNNSTAPDFAVTPRMTLTVLGRAMAAAVKAATRMAIAVHESYAARTGLDLRIASIPENFKAVERGPFDHLYMKALFAFAAGEMRDGAAFDRSRVGPQVTASAR